MSGRRHLRQLRPQGVVVRRGFVYYNSFSPTWYTAHPLAWRAAAWTAAGQDLHNFPAYIAHSLEISAGYADAMAFDESLPLFVSGTCVGLACIAFCWRVSRTVTDRPMAIAASLYLAFSLFVM